MAGEGNKPSACRRLGVYLGTWVNRVVVENRILCCTTVRDRCTVCWMLGKVRLLGSGKKPVIRSRTQLTGSCSFLPRGQMKACSPCVCTHVAVGAHGPMCAVCGHTCNGHTRVHVCRDVCARELACAHACASLGVPRRPCSFFVQVRKASLACRE